MKNKIIIFLALMIILSPAVSRADIIIPMANLTVSVATQTEDNNFDFNLRVQSGSNPVFYNYSQFSLQTQNLSGSYSSWIAAFAGMNYSLRQESIPGLRINILCASDNPNQSFSYWQDGVIFSPRNGEKIICTFNNTTPQGKTPVLIVPGLTGTELFKNTEKLWADATRMLTNIGDSFMDPLSFNENLMPSDNSVFPAKVVSRELTFDYTEGLVNEFTNQGYVENESLFTFPYDWRYGVSGKYSDGTTNADLLAQKIQNILCQTGSDKVDVVAHSLGGLIVKKYAMEHLADNHVGKAVFVGVPNTGAPKAVKVLLQGDNLDVLGLNDQEIKKISQNMPAVYDLLPSQTYYNNAGSFVETIDAGGPLNPTSIVKDLNYDESKSFLTSEHDFNLPALNNAEGLHVENFDNFDLRTAGINLYAIDGCKAGTLGKIVEVRYKDIYGNNYVMYNHPGLTPGDNTVPLESATNLPIDQDNKYYALVSDHGKMPSQDGIRQEIVNLISGSNLSVNSNLITQDISWCDLNGKAISVFSPINISAIDQAGNKLGFAEDGSIINEIPNADFEILGDHKFVYLPQDEGQTYRINMQGTDTGTYTIKVDDIKNSQTTKAELFSNLSVTTNLTGQININSSGSATTLSLNNSKKPILPSAVLTSEQSENYKPPVPTFMPTSKDQCKNNGWKNFGNVFKNQGNCVSFIQTGK